MLDEGDPLWQDVLACGNQDGIQEQLVVLQDEVGSLTLAVDVGVVSAAVQGDIAADEVCQAQQWPFDIHNAKFILEWLHVFLSRWSMMCSYSRKLMSWTTGPGVLTHLVDADVA